MPTTVKGTALTAGDVIQDFANTGDSHPYVVVAKTQYEITLRNCTSHETSALTLLKVVKADKTGDQSWSGKDSYVVKSGTTLGLNVYQSNWVEGEGTVNIQVPSGPPVLMQFQGPMGPYFDYVQPYVVQTVPRLVQVFSDINYRKVGTIKSSRMKTLLEELAS